ncbi:MAG: pyrroline-5-carboxylate reductase [Firmicutes bacterium]|nr:pyrroline-5-carboxylate reductase [Bacillota bacterium]
MKNIGFIGMGNMAQALAKGFIGTGTVPAEYVFAYAPNQEKLAANAQKIGFTPCRSLRELAAVCDTLIMACKPYQIESVLGELGGAIIGKALISVAAGWDYDKYAEYLPEGVAVQYIMPNTPVAVSSGVILMEEKNSLIPEEREQLMYVLSSVGGCVELPSHLMNAGMAISGCGPAFFDMIIEALGDGGVKNGLPRDKAYHLAAATMAGTAILFLDSGMHPGQLKDQVCSPAGTTIRGVAALEEAGVRSAFIKAVDATMKK